MLMDKVKKRGRPEVEQSSVRGVRFPVRIWNKIYKASKGGYPMVKGWVSK